MNPSLSTAGSLALWHTVLIAGLRDAHPDLTLRQMAILLTVYVTPQPHTVRGLAQTLAISKPAVTRALDRLGMLDLAKRKRDSADGRNVLVQRTIKGSVFLSEFADSVATAVGEIKVGDSTAMAA